MLPLPIHFLRPLSTHESPSRRAVVSSETESEPWSGSVSANAPIFSAGHAGSQRSFCSSDPHSAIERIANPACTPTKVPMLPSPRLSSMVTSPADSGSISGCRSPEPSPTSPAAPSFSIRARGTPPLPVVVDGGQDDVVDELTRPGQIAELVGGELVAQEEVVGGQRIADAGFQVVGHGVFSSLGTGPAAGGSACRNSSITGTSSPGSATSSRCPPR